MSATLAPLPAPTAVGLPPAGGPASRLMSRLRRFTVAEYHALIQSGVLPEGNQAELLEGLVVTKMPKNSPHITALRQLDEAMRRLMPAGWTQWSQDPITLSDSEPEPDYAVVRGTTATYRGRKPGPADIGLLVEVADSSLADDRTDKGRIYARAGVPVYWIVNLPDRQVEVYTAPDPAADPPAYRVRTDYRPGDAVPVTLDGAAVGTVPVADLLP